MAEQTFSVVRASARHRFRQGGDDVGTGMWEVLRCVWVVGIVVGGRLSAAGAFRIRTVRHENDSSPTIFEICGSFSRRVFWVLHEMSVICVLES